MHYVLQESFNVCFEPCALIPKSSWYGYRRSLEVFVLHAVRQALISETTLHELYLFEQHQLDPMTRHLTANARETTTWSKCVLQWIFDLRLSNPEVWYWCRSDVLQYVNPSGTMMYGSNMCTQTPLW